MDQTINLASEYAIETDHLDIYYGSFRAVKETTLQIEQKKITAIIGPSGCGKSTVLRSFNRMNDFIPGAHVEGKILFHGENIYDPSVDPVMVRKHIGMVFPEAQPFPQVDLRQHCLGSQSKSLLGLDQ